MAGQLADIWIDFQYFRLKAADRKFSDSDMVEIVTDVGSKQLIRSRR